MPSLYLPADFVARYARPPARTTVDNAVSIHENVRAQLGQLDYSTLLQGSYKNDTALHDMNDVDIVAVSTSLTSAAFNGGLPGWNAVPWPEVFNRIEQRLQSDYRYAGKWTRQDKCIRLNTGIRVDIVPAVKIGNTTGDPVAIYSFRSGRERMNWPRGHYDAAAAKSGRTNGAYKQTVRLFKRWARCWFGSRKVAASYYLECLVFAQPDSVFTGRLADDFVAIAGNVLRLSYHTARLPRLVGDGDLLTPAEWEQSAFEEFQRTLRQAAVHAQQAVSAFTESQARANWIAAFNGQPPT